MNVVPIIFGWPSALLGLLLLSSGVVLRKTVLAVLGLVLSAGFLIYLTLNPLPFAALGFAGLGGNVAAVVLLHRKRQAAAGAFLTPYIAVLVILSIAVLGEQSGEGMPYGYGPCAEESLIGRVGFPGSKPILVKRVGPDRGLRDAIEGFVVVRAIIDREGRVCSATVVRSLGSEADRAAVDAVKQWRFEPAKLNGEPWPVEMHLTVEFRSGSPD